MSTLQKLISTFEASKVESISSDKIKIWMKSENIEVLGALYSYITKPENSSRIIPALSQAEYSNFLKYYFGRCLYENPEGDWSDTRYSAARAVTGWFLALWEKNELNKKDLDEIKNWLAMMYKESNADVRRCIIDGTLEHLFENNEISSYFNDWKNNPELVTAYREAIEWSKDN